MNEQSIARVYLKDRSADQVTVTLGGTNYALSLKACGTVRPTPQGRLSGVIRLPVWKVDEVSAGGGAYIEPIYGKPRRVQGRIASVDESDNSVTLQVGACPVVAMIPARWPVGGMKIGTVIAVDILEGAAFEPSAQPAAVK